jgi:hypothetical protein
VFPSDTAYVSTVYGARSFLNGRAAPGEHITVTFDGNRRFPAIADANGEWEVQFNGGGILLEATV